MGDKNSDSARRANELVREFLADQERAYRALTAQHPGEAVDLYRNRLEDLFANLRVLMYYAISPHRLDSLLKLHKAHRDFALLDERGLPPEAYDKAVENLHILLYKHGQLNTFRTERSLGATGQPIPWITYPALEFLSQFDYADSSVFEFGSGYSTLFWARRSRTVTSIETDKAWFDAISKEKPPNVQLLHIADAAEFASSILASTAAFDVIMIDSLKHRYAATLNAVEKLAAGGLVIFDNSDWYPNSCRLLRDAGLLQIDFHGFGPINRYAWTTSIFFRASIGLRRLTDDLRPIGGIVARVDDDAPVT